MLVGCDHIISPHPFIPNSRDHQVIKRSIGTNRVLVIAAIFLATFTNVAFFQNLFAGLSDTPWVIGHFLSVAMVLLCLLVIFLSVLSSRPLIKPALVLVFMFSAIAAYFMDTFNVIIDADMIANVMATEPDIVATGNIGCMTQLSTHMDKIGSNVQVRHTMQVLRDAYESNT